MKSRSHQHHNHRLPNSDPPDDWVNGSWTVDCLCGVNFDDGEEMVNCDECGVWVHTRCSRYMKADDSFVCDKCKAKNSRTNNNNDDSEETEVAQLLVELPTKTVRMENNRHHPGRNAATTRRPPPVRLWAEVPMEERVHIQGRPGGDPALFRDSAGSVFSPELWKCSGYVPKRFNFRYKEFPCWEEEESESPADKGAGVLFSLSKEGTLAEVGGGPDRRKLCLKERKKWDGGVEKKEGSSGGSRRPVMEAQPPKRRREDSGASKDRSSRKRGRTLETEVDTKKRTTAHSSKTVFTPTSDAKHLAFYEDRAPKFPKGEVRSAKNKTLRESVVNNEVKSNGTNVKSCWKELSSSDVVVEDCSVDKEPMEDKVGPHQTEVPESSRKLDNSVCSTGDHDDAGKMHIQEKGDGAFVSMPDCLEVSDKNFVKVTSETVEVKEITVKHSNGDLPRESKLLNSSVKEENMDNNYGSLLNVQSSPHHDANDHGISSDHKSESPQLNGTKAATSHSSDHKAENIDQRLEAAAIDSHVKKTEQFSDDHCLLKSELEVTEGLMALQKSPTEKHCCGHLDENSKLGGTVSISQRKLLACSGKSASNIGLIHKSSAEAQHPNPFAKPQNTTHDNSNVNARKDRSSQDIRNENLRRTVKDRPKSLANPIPKPSNSSRVSHDSLPKRPIESKENLLSASAKTSSCANVAAVTSGAGEHQKATHTQIRSSASGLSSSKGEKPSQPNFQAPTKINPNNVPSVCPPIPSSSPAALSDEELALLLHQELNSSPRVPRVPRARNAGNLPQLASPSVTTLLMKRPSSSGGKDHSSAPKRKYRDGPRDGFRSSQDGTDEAKKLDRVSSSHDPKKKRDTEYVTEEASTKREENGSSGMESEKKNAPSTSAATNSGPSSSNEANDRNMSSIRSSPNNASDDDTGAVGGPIHRTLPGLINEIMSKGRRMTYEELCNAVLPHWHNLRKHNGERYAYSSHSQAVLDCLRNRHEWARLVDRGPKTNSTRKRRKTDAEDSEDNDLSKGKPSSQTESKSLESQKEEFPKGKRKARKRRRLALQGKGIKDIRKRRKQDDHRFTDEDFGTSSNSSDESSTSEGGPRPDGSEASTSSDDGDTI